MASHFHLAVPVLVYRHRNQSIPYRFSSPGLIKQLL